MHACMHGSGTHGLHALGRHEDAYACELVYRLSIMYIVQLPSAQPSWCCWLRSAHADMPKQAHQVLGCDTQNELFEKQGTGGTGPVITCLLLGRHRCFVSTLYSSAARRTTSNYVHVLVRQLRCSVVREGSEPAQAPCHGYRAQLRCKLTSAIGLIIMTPCIPTCGASCNTCHSPCMTDA